MEANKPQEYKSDSKKIQDFLDLQSISNHNGWLIYKRELQDLYDKYSRLMDGLDTPVELIKNYQLIKRGLKLAMDIPRVMEIKAKNVKNNSKRSNNG